MLAFILAISMVGTDLSRLTIPPEMMVVPPDAKEIWLDKLHECENKNDVPRILDINDKYSYGAFMFQMDTWLSYGKGFGATRKNIENDELQREVARDMLDNGGWRHWQNCVNNMVRPELGDYPL